jgi:hypothetical protein
VRKTIGSALFVGGLVALLCMTAGAAIAAPGNNGDVKVAGTSVDDIPNNAPHQGCQFDLEFYNFDLGSPDATYAFTLTAPTKPNGDDVLSSGSVAVGGGPLDGFGQLDAVASVDLSDPLGASGVDPVNQGFHVRLDVTGAGLHGNGAKSKTFWVAGDCGGGSTLPG